MKHGYFSKILANKKWFVCPVWEGVSEANSAGKLYEVVFVINNVIQDDYIKNFLNHNKQLYPDLIYLGELERCVAPGVKI